jgi:hypothetical protein
MLRDNSAFYDAIFQTGRSRPEQETVIQLLLPTSSADIPASDAWAIKLALAPRTLMIYCASPLAAAMIITVAALRIVLAYGSKPT